MILVDPLRDYPYTLLQQKRWCHMVSDANEAELHDFAAQLGLKRSWFQSREAGNASAAHYDLTPRRRLAALRLGAVEVTARELVTRNYDGLRQRSIDRGIIRPR